MAATKKPTSLSRAKLPRGRGGAKPAASAKTNQATTEDMQREDLGVAAKE